jgi:hypothetical protein
MPSTKLGMWEMGGSDNRFIDSTDKNGTDNDEMRIERQENRKHSASGPGWSATLREGEPVTLGPLRFNTAHVAIEGEAFALDRLFAAFDKRMPRPGG